MLHVTIQQPALPKYRVPVFRQLNEDVELSVSLVYSNMEAIPNVEPDGFAARTAKTFIINIPKIGPLYWDTGQIDIARNKHNDVIVLSWGNRYLSLIPALLLARRNGIKTVLWGHGYSKRNSNRFNTWIRKKLTGLANAILFYDPITRDNFIESTGLSNCFSASNTIDLEPVFQLYDIWQSNTKNLDDFKNMNNISDRHIVLHVSRLDRMNRVHDLIDAVASAKQSIPSILLIIIGSGDEALKNELISQATALGCDNNIRFLGAIYSEEELAPWYCAADTFCYPSNIGLSLMHAFGYALPVIIGDNLSKCNPEIYAFRDKYNGLLYKQENIASLEKALVDIMKNNDLQKTLSLGAQDTATNVVTLENMVTGFKRAIVHAFQDA